MISENPTQRPSASTLIHHPCIVPDASKSKSQLRKELNKEKFKNEMLKRKVKKYEEQLCVSGGASNASIGIANFQKTNDPLAHSTINNKNLNLNFSTKFARSLSSTLL